MRDFISTIKKGFTLYGLMIVIAMIGLLAFTAAPAMAAGNQGDEVWTASPPLATVVLGTDGAGLYARGVVFPYDSNSQPVAYYVEFTPNTAGDVVEVYAYQSRVTNYQTTTLAFSGGNTNYVHAPNAMQGLSGASYFVLDDGAGNAGWGEYLDGAGTGTGDIIEAHNSGGSNFAYGPGNTDNLSGTTFISGSRVFPLQKIGEIVGPTANTVKSVDNNSGIFAAPKGSPLLFINRDSTTGVTIHAVTAKYE